MEDSHLLGHLPALDSHLKVIVTGLKRRQLLGSLQCAKATIEILRSVLGTCKFHSTHQMMQTVRAIGRNLTRASPSELSIGNIVKRLLFLIREEYANKLKSIESASSLDKSSGSVTGKSKRSPSSAVGKASTVSVNELSKAGHSISNQTDSSSLSHSDVDLEMKANTSPVAQISLGRVLSEVDLSDENIDPAEEFSLMFPDMRQLVMASINEINEELDNLYAPICDQAQEHIHADECILVYGHSLMVESFLKAAARKRRFQVIIAEAAPGLSGIKLANALSKLSNNIATTLIPDSNIYAIMSRVNKVIMSPHAVMMDGGCMSLSGNLMVALAAKEFSVPVVCLAGTYIMTPLFAHNQRAVLEQLLSPAQVIPYNALVNFDNIEVFVPAFDLLSPNLVDLYVTNNGSHQPSYVYRLLSELYHSHDYDL